MKQYFEKGDKNGLCANKKRRKFSDCKRQYLVSTSTQSKNMIEALNNMNECSGADKRKCMTTEYANFGKAFSTNQFTFQTIFSLLKGRGIKANYAVTGQEIKRYELLFDWKSFVEKK